MDDAWPPLEGPRAVREAPAPDAKRATRKVRREHDVLPPRLKSRVQPPGGPPWRPTESAAMTTNACEPSHAPPRRDHGRQEPRRQGLGRLPAPAPLDRPCPPRLRNGGMPNGPWRGRHNGGSGPGWQQVASRRNHAATPSAGRHNGGSGPPTTSHRSDAGKAAKSWTPRCKDPPAPAAQTALCACRRRRRGRRSAMSPCPQAPMLGSRWPCD